MKILLMVLIIFVMAGCTTYSIEKVTPDGSTTVVHVKSTRDLEQPELHYERVGNDASFDFQAAGVDNNSEMFQGMMAMMLQMMQQMIIPAPTDGER